MDGIGPLLRTAFEPPAEPLPDAFNLLLARLASDADRLSPGLDEVGFKAALTAMIPRLRARARYLTRDPVSADDLVQDTLMRAWDKRGYYRADSNFTAWSYTILRNLFFNQTKRARFRATFPDGRGEPCSATQAGQEDRLHLADVDRALAQLAPAHQQVLMLVGAAQLSYEEAAEICGTKIGTVKSRAARARVALALLIDGSEPAGHL